MATELVAGGHEETRSTTKKMQIFVDLPRRPGRLMIPNTISLEVSSSDTVASLKARLEGIVRTQYVNPIPATRQRLVLAGSALPDDDDGRTLADLGVADSSTVQLVETQMAVYVRDPFYHLPRSTHGMLGLSSTDTVDTIKARYEAATGMPTDRMRLRYLCQEMRNGSTLGDWGVEHGSTVIVDRLQWHQTEAGHALSRVLMVKVYRRDTVRRVKELVEAAEGMPVATQRAYCNLGLATGYTDEDLEDGRTMEELGVMESNHESVLNEPFVNIEYRLEAGAAAAAEEGQERQARVPRVLFRGSPGEYNKIVMRRLLAMKEKSYSTPPVPPRTRSRLLHVYLGARDPLLP
ncbi:hypothetical protein ACQ4PT_064277 [Festuca glaucescens]